MMEIIIVSITMTRMFLLLLMKIKSLQHMVFLAGVCKLVVQRTPTLPRNHAPSCIYRQLIGEFQGLFVIYLFCSALQNKYIGKLCT